MELGFRVVESNQFENRIGMDIPLCLSAISAGFPSSASDYVEKTLDLNEHLIKHPAATFFVRVEGNSMIGSGIHSGDILIVDKSLEPGQSSIVVAAINGDFTVKRIKKEGNRFFLMPENPKYEPIDVAGDMQVEIWGVVTYVIHKAQ
jgi:DNA polymerase V